MLENNKIKQKLLKELGNKIQENIALANYTSFKIGGLSKYFFIAKNNNEIIKAVITAKKLNLKFFILGNGSNVLISDNGFNGLVIKAENTKCQLKNNNIICAEAGALLYNILQFAINNSLTGLEWAIGIPGTIAGAVRGNAGAYGNEISNLVKKVKALNKDSQIIDFDNKRCCFNYRESIFKKDKNLIILEVELKLTNGDKNKIKEKVQKILEQRKTKIPDLPNAGSIFKNVPINRLSKLVIDNEMPIINNKVPAAWFIEKLGLKGFEVGDAKVSEKHANIIINNGNATAEQVIELISLIKTRIRDKLGIQLEEEVQYIGFD